MSSCVKTSQNIARSNAKRTLNPLHSADFTFAKPVTKRQRTMPTPTSAQKSKEEQEGPGAGRGNKKRKGKDGKAMELSLVPENASTPEAGTGVGGGIESSCANDINNLARYKRGNYARRGRKQDPMKQTGRSRPDGGLKQTAYRGAKDRSPILRNKPRQRL